MLTGLEVMALGAGIGAVGNMVAAYMASGNADKANELIQAAVEKYGPEAEGVISDYASQELATSGLSAEAEAPEAVAAQREALRRMQQVAAGGYTPEEETALRNIQSQTAAMASSQQAALQGQLQRQGVLDSGARIAMQQAAGQAAANRAGQAGLETAAQAQRRAFQAMQGLGGLGTSVRGQAYGEAERRAQAEDQKRLFEASSRLNVASNKLGAASGAGQAQGQFGQVGPSMISAGATGLGTGLISYGSRGQGLQDDLDKKKGG